MNAVELQDVHKSFGRNEVLRGIDLAVAEHEVVCMIGASGSGKSTLLRCVNRVRREIGIVFQSYNLFPHMSVLGNVTLGPRKALGLSRADAEQRADELLARFGLEDKRGAYPDSLSGGQKLMLLDEITSALDPELVAEVLNVVRELAQGGLTMLIATHEMVFARDIADRVCFLDEGVILEEGPPEQIFAAPREPRTQQFLARIVEAGRL